MSTASPEAKIKVRKQPPLLLALVPFICLIAIMLPSVSAHNFRKKRAFFVKGATVATKCINKSRMILKRSSGSSLLVLA